MTTLLKSPPAKYQLESPTGRVRITITPEGTRRLTILAMIIGLMAVFVPLLGFSIDFGQMTTVRQELESRVQASAFSAAGSLLVAPTREASTQSPPLSCPPAITPGADRSIKMRFGRWDDSTRHFQVTDGDQANAVQATGAGRTYPLFFSQLLGRDTFSASATAVGVLKPREIVLILDCSASMQPTIEAAIGRLANQLAHSRTDDRLALVLLGDEHHHTTMRIPLSRDLSHIPQTLAERAPMRQSSAEHLTVAIRIARRHLQKTGRPDADRAIWIVSDRSAAAFHLNPLVHHRLENELGLTEDQSIRIDSILGSAASGSSDSVVELIRGTTGRHQTLARGVAADPQSLDHALGNLESDREVMVIH